MMNTPQQVKNPSSSLKSRFITRFLGALTKINAEDPISSSSPTRIFQRYRRIKVASNKSMAYSVRSRRIWSRTMLSRFRSRRSAFSGRRSSVKTTNCTTSPPPALIKVTINEKKTAKGGLDMQTDELRELVPGGEAMDVCNLLDETAHYIKCLTTQVQVMRKIVDFYHLSK
ncbi:transcription factor IBH1-like [Gossypium arboreum]|uniref:IBH1-like N-terminal domain-containing protein n=1 Tax=Gossypium arboreum TaxID=29729 RepID=A0ABR0PDR9_GOSAR|nr:transcription factor IBH1-like [Gossypium arboreum]KAK5819457.1 hypothetical protein PVK06_024458 [Gossypium arboreum]